MSDLCFGAIHCFCIFYFRRHLYVTESIALLERNDGICIGLGQRLAIQTVTVKNARLYNAQPLLDDVAVEIFVPADGNVVHFMFISQIDGKHDCGMLRIYHLLAMRDLHVVVSLALEIIANAAVAFVQKIFVHGAFFIDRHEILNLAFAQ